CLLTAAEGRARAEDFFVSLRRSSHGGSMYRMAKAFFFSPRFDMVFVSASTAIVMHLFSVCFHWVELLSFSLLHSPIFVIKVFLTSMLHWLWLFASFFLFCMAWALGSGGRYRSVALGRCLWACGAGMAGSRWIDMFVSRETFENDNG